MDNVISIFEIRQRARAREKRRRIIRNLIIGALVILIALLLLGARKGGNGVEAYDYDTCMTLWDLADKHCPESIDKRDFIEEVRQINGMADYKVYADRLYQYPVYKKNNER